MAKTQYSFSTDPNLRGAPDNHSVPVREVRLCGAGFIVVVCGEIMTMPGLPRKPAAETICLNDEGLIEGLSKTPLGREFFAPFVYSTEYNAICEETMSAQIIVLARHSRPKSAAKLQNMSPVLKKKTASHPDWPLYWWGKTQQAKSMCVQRANKPSKRHEFYEHKLDADTSQDDLLKLIADLNADKYAWDFSSATLAQTPERRFGDQLNCP